MRSFPILVLFLAAPATVGLAQQDRPAKGSPAGIESNLVAGRTIDQYRRELDATDRTVRLRAVRSLAPFGLAAGEALRSGLDHEDAAVRYLAAVQLGRIGDDPLVTAKPKLQSLAAEDLSAAVRIAAAFALCRAGDANEHLPQLVKAMQYPERGMACSAAELIGQIGAAAESAIPDLQRMIDNNRPGGGKGDYHVGGAAINALQSVQRSIGTDRVGEQQGVGEQQRAEEKK